MFLGDREINLANVTHVEYLSASGEDKEEGMKVAIVHFVGGGTVRLLVDEEFELGLNKLVPATPGYFALEYIPPAAGAREVYERVPIVAWECDTEGAHPVAIWTGVINCEAVLTPEGRVVEPGALFEDAAAWRWHRTERWKKFEKHREVAAATKHVTETPPGSVQ